MNESDRLNLRARQILDDPDLSQNQRIPNAGALFKHVVRSAQIDPSYLSAILAEISDPIVRDAFSQAVLEAVQGPQPVNQDALNSDVLVAALSAKVSAQADLITAAAQAITAPLDASATVLAQAQVTAQEVQAQAVSVQAALSGPTPLPPTKAS